MGDHEERGTGGFGLVKEQIEHSACRGGIKVSGGFVAEDEFGLAEEGAADADALTLALREPAGFAGEDVGDAGGGGELLGASCVIAIGRATDVAGEEDVLAGGEVFEELELLEDHADLGEAEVGALWG